MKNFSSKRLNRESILIDRITLSQSSIIDNIFAAHFNVTESLEASGSKTLDVVKGLYSLSGEGFSKIDEYISVVLAGGAKRRWNVNLMLDGYEKMQKHFGGSSLVKNYLSGERKKICEALKYYEVEYLYKKKFNDAFALAYRVTKSRERALDAVSKSFQTLLELDSAKFLDKKNQPAYLSKMVYHAALKEKEYAQKVLPVIKEVEAEEIAGLFSKHSLELKIQAILDAMQPPRYAEILRLFYWQQYSLENIAQEMGLSSVGNSKVLLYRARKAFLKLYSPPPFNPDDDPGSKSSRSGQTAKMKKQSGCFEKNAKININDINNFQILDYFDIDAEVSYGYQEMAIDFGKEAVFIILENEKRKLAKQLFDKMHAPDKNILPELKFCNFLQLNINYIDGENMDERNNLEGDKDKPVLFEWGELLKQQEKECLLLAGLIAMVVRERSSQNAFVTTSSTGDYFPIIAARWIAMNDTLDSLVFIDRKFDNSKYSNHLFCVISENEIKYQGQKFVERYCFELQEPMTRRNEMNYEYTYFERDEEITSLLFSPIDDVEYKTHHGAIDLTGMWMPEEAFFLDARRIETCSSDPYSILHPLDWDTTERHNTVSDEIMSFGFETNATFAQITLDEEV